MRKIKFLTLLTLMLGNKSLLFAQNQVYGKWYSVQKEEYFENKLEGDIKKFDERCPMSVEFLVDGTVLFIQMEDCLNRNEGEPLERGKFNKEKNTVLFNDDWLYNDHIEVSISFVDENRMLFEFSHEDDEDYTYKIYWSKNDPSIDYQKEYFDYVGKKVVKENEVNSKIDLFLPYTKDEVFKTTFFEQIVYFFNILGHQGKLYSCSPSYPVKIFNPYGKMEKREAKDFLIALNFGNSYNEVESEFYFFDIDKIEKEPNDETTASQYRIYLKLPITFNYNNYKKLEKHNSICLKLDNSAAYAEVQDFETIMQWIEDLIENKIHGNK